MYSTPHSVTQRYSYIFVFNTKFVYRYSILLSPGNKCFILVRVRVVKFASGKGEGGQNQEYKYEILPSRHFITEGGQFYENKLKRNCCWRVEI